MHVLCELHPCMILSLIALVVTIFIYLFMNCMLYILLFDLTPSSYDSALRRILGTLANSALCLRLRMIARLLNMLLEFT